MWHGAYKEERLRVAHRVEGETGVFDRGSEKCQGAGQKSEFGLRPWGEVAFSR